MPPFDILVSNPPYRCADPAFMPSRVHSTSCQWRPQIASLHLVSAPYTPATPHQPNSLSNLPGSSICNATLSNPALHIPSCCCCPPGPPNGCLGAPSCGPSRACAKAAWRCIYVTVTSQINNLTTKTSSALCPHHLPQLDFISSPAPASDFDGGCRHTR